MSIEISSYIQTSPKLHSPIPGSQRPETREEVPRYLPTPGLVAPRPSKRQGLGLNPV